MNLTTVATRTAELEATLKGEGCTPEAAFEAGLAYGKAVEELSDRRHSIFTVTLNRPAPIPGMIVWAVYAEEHGDRDYRLDDGTQLEWDSIDTTSRMSYLELPSGVREAFDL